MAYLFNLLPFPEDSRLTGLWTNAWVDPPFGEEIAHGQLLALGDDQDPFVESDFLSSHLPFQIGGLHGRFPNGSGWLFVLQKAPISLNRSGVRAATPVLAEALDRALKYNTAARPLSTVVLTQARLRETYRRYGADPAAIATWPVTDLVNGLLAQCCGADLLEVVAGRPAGCAFPDQDHLCQHDVFQDVFVSWMDRAAPGT